MAPERIDQLNEGLRQLAAATHDVSTEVARSVNVELEKGRRVLRWGLGAVAVLLVPSLIACIACTILLVQSRERAIANRDLTLQNRQLLDRITDCTTPGRACYEQAQRRTAGVLKQLLADEEAIAWCTKTTATEADLKTCVGQRVAATAHAG